ncbi:UDP-2,3-diacylglucosamine hydrolase, partial [Frankliniella fusca]
MTAASRSTWMPRRMMENSAPVSSRQRHAVAPRRASRSQDTRGSRAAGLGVSGQAVLEVAEIAPADAATTRFPTDLAGGAGCPGAGGQGC